MEENLRFIKIIYLETVHFNNKLIHLRNKTSAETLTTDRMIPSGRIVHQQKLQIQNKTNPVEFCFCFSNSKFTTCQDHQNVLNIKHTAHMI